MFATITKGFLLPGNLVSDLIGADASDDRGMIRILINMLFWNFVGAVIAISVV